MVQMEDRKKELEFTCNWCGFEFKRFVLLKGTVKDRGSQVQCQKCGQFIKTSGGN